MVVLGSSVFGRQSQAFGIAIPPRLWKRGTDLKDAEILINADPEIVFNFPMSSIRSDGTYAGIIQGPDFSPRSST